MRNNMTTDSPEHHHSPSYKKNKNDYDSKLSQLQSRLDDITQKNKGDSTPSPPMQQGLGLALRIGIELVVAVIVGIGIGYFLDTYLNTRPFLMILMSFIGLAAGVSNIYRLMAGYHMGVGYKKKNEKRDKKDNL